MHPRYKNSQKFVIDSYNGKYAMAFVGRYKYTRVNTESILFKMLTAIYANPFATRREIQAHVYPNRKYFYSSYGGDIWRNILADELVMKVRKGNEVGYVLGDKGFKLISQILIRSNKIK